MCIRDRDKSERVVVVVDCENSDPYKLYATLNNLNQEALLLSLIHIYGEIDLTDLEPGAYKVTEQAAPDGYLIDDATRVIDVYKRQG